MSKYKELPASFVGQSGRFYVRQRKTDGGGFLDRVTVWPSVEDYDSRTPVPLSFCDTNEAVADFSHGVRIYDESLTTTPPAYPADPDETDMGVTPQRNLWLNRFLQAEEGRSHAA